MSKWTGDEFFRKNEKAFAANLLRAAIHLTREIKKNISDPPPASAPGEFPHRDDGELRRSITYEVDKETLVARVGTNKVYGRYLETGTSEMEKRPFLVPTLAAEHDNVAKILAKKPDIEGT